MQETYKTLLQRFLRAFCRSLPDLPEQELAYRFYFLFGAEVNTLIDDGTIHAIDKRLLDLHQEPEGVARRLVHFTAAGMRAPLCPQEDSAPVPEVAATT